MLEESDVSMPHAAIFWCNIWSVNRRFEYIHVSMPHAAIFWCNLVTRSPHPIWGETAFWKVMDFFVILCSRKKNIRFKIMT